MNKKNHLSSDKGNGYIEKPDRPIDLRKFCDKADKSGMTTAENLRKAGIVIDPLELFRLMESED